MIFTFLGFAKDVLKKLSFPKKTGIHGVDFNGF